MWIFYEEMLIEWVKYMSNVILDVQAKVNEIPAEIHQASDNVVQGLTGGEK